MIFHIVGQGKWGRRLAEEHKKLGSVVTWTHEDSGDIDGDEIIVAVPGPYLTQTLARFRVNPKVLVTSATKGLDTIGRLPSDTIKLMWGSRTIRTLGGACISSQSDLDMQYGGEDLEVAGILKNVYAIGFSYLKAKKSDNYAAVWFVKVWDELRGVVKKEEFLSDLVVTCMSEASRNNKAGLLLSRGEPIEFQDCQVAEGVHTAEMIEKFNLFHGLPLLREITKIVVSRQRYDEWE